MCKWEFENIRGSKNYFSNRISKDNQIRNSIYHYLQTTIETEFQIFLFFDNRSQHWPISSAQESKKEGMEEKLWLSPFEPVSFLLRRTRKRIYETTWPSRMSGCADGANPEIRNARRFTKSNRFLWTVAGYPRLDLTLHLVIGPSSINLITRFSPDSLLPCFSSCENSRQNYL